jgi:hypothetical protein
VVRAAVFGIVQVLEKWHKSAREAKRTDGKSHFPDGFTHRRSVL